MCYLLPVLAWTLLAVTASAQEKPKPDLPYVELTGKAEGFTFHRQWRSYYWRDDFTFWLKTDDNKTIRVISREPTPWNDLRFGTTYTGLKVDWQQKPRVKVIGVKGIDRTPVEFYDLKLGDDTVTAFIVRVEVEKDKSKDYYVNNWFHKWGKDADAKTLAHYANDDPNYTIYGYVSSQPAPWDKDSQAIYEKHADDYGGLIYHARVVKTDRGHELKMIHLVGRHKKSAEYRVIHGDPRALVKLDQVPPKDKKPKDKDKTSLKRFSDVTAGSGLRTGKDSKPHAVGVGDFDGDGKPDVLIATFDKPHVQLFRNKGGLTFEDATKGSGLESFTGAGSGVALADFDGDGWLDVYVTSVYKGESRLFRNKGKGKFEDVSMRSGTLLKPGARSCAWSDVDGDGRLDLFVCVPDGANRLYRNKGDGTFEEVGVAAGVAYNAEGEKMHALGCAFGDFDGDGKDDLFVTCYKSQSSALYRNASRGTFVDVTKKSGLGRKASSVGCVFADVFNRGVLDLYVTTDSWLAGANYTEKQLLEQKHTVEPNALYRNDGKGKFAMADDKALALKTLAHDAVIEDLDHDGLVEIYCAVDAESGNQWATSKGGDRLWARPDGKSWKDVATEWGVKHEANCVCVGVADFDGDGDLDMLLVNFYSEVVLLRNNTDDGNWLRVKSLGKGGNRDAIGAKVRLLDASGSLLATRHVQSGSGYCRSSPAEAHFGLGRKPAASYSVEVTFPSGKKVTQKDVKPGRTMTVKEPA